MRRPLAVSALVLGLAVAPLGAGAEAGDPSGPRRAVASGTSPVEAVRTAREVLSGSDRTPATGRGATLALRDLFAARPRLTGEARAAADRLLARPRGDHRRCGDHVCVHWSTSGPNRASNTWAATTLDYLGRVWRKEIGKLGYRAPLKDGSHGGNAKLDVYLEDLGGQGLYGYCAPEYVGDRPRTASGYCVLDNDFARAQFGIRPVDALHVTAAHEFFHASQFAYDYREDAWLMEATATWMEEQVADGVNDNRQYLPHGQLGTPGAPLDRYDPNGVGQYGQWLYFQYLQQLYGRGVVRSIWNQLPGRTHYSVQVLEDAVPDTFASQYAGFVAANLLPGSFYAEGGHYSKPYPSPTGVDAGGQLSDSATLDHLTSWGAAVVPGSGLKSGTWQLQVSMDGPPEASLPMLVVVWQGTSGEVQRFTVDTDQAGTATTSVAFSSANTRAVYYAAVNAGTSYDCYHDDSGDQYYYACQGVSRDDDKVFDLSVSTFQG